MNPRWWTAALATLAVGAGLLAVWMPDAPSSPYVWQVGTTDAYDVVWTTSARATLPLDDTAPFDVTSRLVGVFDVTTLETLSDGGVVQRGHLRTVDRLDVVVGDQSASVDRGTLIGVPVRFTRSADGALVDAHVAPSTPAPTANTLLGLVKTFSIPAPGTTERRTPFGRALDRWDGETRTTLGFQELAGAPAFAALQGTGTATVRWRDGRLVSADATDTASATSTGTTWLVTHDATEWRLRDDPPDTPVARLPAAPSGPGRAETGTPAEGWSPGRVVTGVNGFDPGDDAGPILWNGTRALARDADLRARIGALAGRPGTPHPRRELALDLLAHTPDGLGEAELLAALRQLEGDPYFPAYLQRTSFLTAPGSATLDALRHWQTLGGDVARAATAALGAVAGRLGDPSVLEDLRGSLAADPEDAASQLAALGNAHHPSDRPTIESATRDPRSRVRAAGLHALRHYGDPQAAATLLSGTRDPHAGVQRAALSGLAERPLDAGGLDGLVALATDGTVHGANLGLLVTVLAPYASVPRTRPALEALLGHPGGNPTLRARIRSILEDAP
jgi:hypothetical protein